MKNNYPQLFNKSDWHGFRIGENDITMTKIDFWTKNADVAIWQVVEIAQSNGFLITKFSNSFLRVYFNSVEDVNKFYKLVMSIY